MKIFEDYVLVKELVQKAKVGTSLFHHLKGVNIYKMGKLAVVKKAELPCKYLSIACKCHDLKNYSSYSYFSEEIGSYSGFLKMQERNKKINFESIKVGRNKLIKLNSDFIEAIKKGDIPFLIRNKEDRKLAEYIINLQGIEIGFY